MVYISSKKVVCVAVSRIQLGVDDDGEGDNVIEWILWRRQRDRVDIMKKMIKRRNAKTTSDRCKAVCWHSWAYSVWVHLSDGNAHARGNAVSRWIIVVKTMKRIVIYQSRSPDPKAHLNRSWMFQEEWNDARTGNRTELEEGCLKMSTIFCNNSTELDR